MVEGRQHVRIKDETKKAIVLVAVFPIGLIVMFVMPFYMEPRFSWQPWALAWWATFTVGLIFPLHIYPAVDATKKLLRDNIIETWKLYHWVCALIVTVGANFGDLIARHLFLPTLAPELIPIFTYPNLEHYQLHQVGVVAVSEGFHHGLLIAVMASGTILWLFFASKLRNHRTFTTETYIQEPGKPLRRSSSMQVLIPVEKIDEVEEITRAKLAKIIKEPRKIKRIAIWATYYTFVGLVEALVVAMLHVTLTWLFWASF